jgi:hypothetical protein
MRQRLPWLVVFLLAATVPRAHGALVVPGYESRPDAYVILYLDFDGDYTPTYGSYHPNTTPAYSIDADVDNFSDAELENIHKIWMGVAEKYSPFDINVSTVNPGYDDNGVSRVVIGGNGAWAPPDSGGIAIEGSFQIFSSLFPNLAFVFPGHLDNGNPRYVAEASAHEAAHGFALAHQSLWVNNNLVAKYNPGDANRAPIMGKSYFATRGQWWLGPSEDMTTQDDLRLLVRNFSYRIDDHPGSPLGSLGAADALLLGADQSISGFGVIEKSTDADFFSFVTAGGPAIINADVAPFAPMLDLSLGLYDAAGNPLVSAATASLGESISAFLAPGTYKLGVFGAGGYGDLGQYFISGFVPEPGSAIAVAGMLIVCLTRRHRGGESA